MQTSLDSLTAPAILFLFPIFSILQEAYVDLLGEHTFPTLMQGFSADDAKDLIAVCALCSHATLAHSFD